MEIDFEILLKKQSELDALIHHNHNVNYETTKTKRLLAFLVELGELANATKAFKFWSLKPSESRERLLDEYADGLHFLLSFALAHNIELPSFSVEEEGEIDVTEKFIACYQSVLRFNEDKDKSSLYLTFSDFIALGQALSFTKEEIVTAYENKLVVNYQRQKEHY